MKNDIPAILVEQNNSRLIPLIQPTLTMGRGEANDVIVTHDEVSRKHAEIHQSNDQFWLKDLGSTNGTWLNGERLVDSKRLQEGDNLRIGKAFFQFYGLHPSKDTVSEWLAHVPLFANLTPEMRRPFVDQAQFILYPPTTRIPIDRMPNALCLVLYGELVMNTSEATTKRFRAGQFFENGRVLKKWKPNTIQATERAWVMLLNREAMNELISPFLRSLSFFSHLSEPHLQALIHHTHFEQYEQDVMLFKEGDEADALYIVLFGSVAIVVNSDEGDLNGDNEIELYTQGALFGELGLVRNQPRAAGAKATRSTGLLVLDKDKFQELLKSSPDIILSLYHYTASLLGKQSLAYRKAAYDIKRLEAVIPTTKMAALGQLVKGLMHEINTPVGSIHSNSNQLANKLEHLKQIHEKIPSLIEAFAEDEVQLQAIAIKTGFTLTESAKVFVRQLISEQRAYLLGYYDKLELEESLDDLTEMSDELKEASHRIAVMVRNMTNFSRVDQAEWKRANIHEGIDATLSLLRHQIKYKVVVEKDYGLLPEIICYPNELNQVFMNILVNAIQAMDLEAPTDKKNVIRIKTYRDGRWLVVAITDSGKGIKPEDMPHIFELSFSTKEVGAAAGGLGLGLGLSISKKIIEEKHHGKIEVTSKVGHGTTFYIKLPFPVFDVDTMSKTLIG